MGHVSLRRRIGECLKPSGHLAEVGWGGAGQFCQRVNECVVKLAANNVRRAGPRARECVGRKEKGIFLKRLLAVEYALEPWQHRLKKILWFGSRNGAK